MKPLPKEEKKRIVIPFHLPKTALPKPKTRLRQLTQKQKIVGVFLCMLLGAFWFGMAVTHKQNDNIQVAVESVSRMDFTGITRIRMLLVSEQAAGAEVLQGEDTGTGETAENGIAEANPDEQNGAWENGTENKAGTGDGETQTGKENRTATEAPATEDAEEATEETTAESTQAP